MLNTDSQTFLYIIIFILVLSNIYLFYKTRNIEGFANPVDIPKLVENEVNDTYLTDISAMRDLANIAQQIMTTQDDLTLPTNITIPGNLKVDGDVLFTNKHTNLMDLFPKFMVIAWASADGIPKGWAKCDGKKYRMNPITRDVEQLIDDSTDPDLVITPDLRGRFILAAGDGIGLQNREIYKTGGEENVKLTLGQMPSHSHDLQDFTNRIGCDGSNCILPERNDHKYSFGGYSGDRLQKWPYGKPGSLITNTGGEGGDQPHNNMPPFYVLIYIMKL